MTRQLLNFTAMLLYVFAALPVARTHLSGRALTPLGRNLTVGLGTLAVVGHVTALYGALLTDATVNLGLFNAGSLIMCASAGILILLMLIRPLASLVTLVFPGAALAIAADLTFSSSRLLPGLSRGIEAHVMLSLLAYSVLAIAAVQALLLAVADHRLRRKQAHTIMRILPPLATMEDLLFQLLSAGLVLLTLGLVTGFVFVDNLLAQHLVHKTVLSIIGWLVFAVLLWGRRTRGWRGRIAVRYTLSGYALLLLAFFGSEFVLQLVLHRV